MKLKTTISIVNFLKDVQRCRGDVFFRTADGEMLNLKAQLANYVFLAMVSAEDLSLIRIGEILCERTQDYALLEQYLEV